MKNETDEFAVICIDCGSELNPGDDGGVCETCWWWRACDEEEAENVARGGER